MPNPTCCSERILVVEDDRDLCGLLSTLLDVEGYRTDVACDGADAVAEGRSPSGPTPSCST